MTNNNKENIEKSIHELEKLFLLDLIPETQEEAQEILLKAEIDTKELKEKGRKIYRDILAEFNDDWRNISEETLESEKSEVLTRKIPTDLSRETLISKILEVTKALAAKGLGAQISTGIAHRNLEKETGQDLASLLRQMEHIAEQAGIKLGEK